jgi:cytochrome c-type biogenesis protein CcmF
MFSSSNIGNFLLGLIVLTSSINIIFALSSIIYSTIRNRLSYKKIILKNIFWQPNKLLINANFLLIFSLFFFLLYCFISSDFSLAIVAHSTSLVLPLKYKIGAIWSSQEGSIILWLFSLSIVGFTMIQKKSLERFLDYIALLYSAQIFFISLLSLLILLPFSENFNESEILGLNPVLQDIALTIHPPILYIGYSLSYAIFVLTIISILYNFTKTTSKEIATKDSQSLYQSSYLLAKLCLLFLSSGVFLGAWWAYRELGWGGYWFFDPVENISLMPLFCLIAYYHSIMVQFKDFRFTNLSNFFGMSIFILILIGTCFTRSGLIISVHSFVNDSFIGYYILSFALCFTIASYIFLYIFSFSKIDQASFPYEFNKKSGIRISNYLWIIAISSILITLLIPIISNIAFAKIITIEEGFFLKTLIPILLMISFTMGMFSYITTPKIKSFIIKFIIALIFSIFITYYFQLKFLNFLGFLISFYILEEVIISLINSIINNQYEKKMAMILSHFGIGLLCLSISCNKSFEKEFDIIGKIGDKIEYDNFAFQIKDARKARNVNYLRQIIDVEIINKNNKESIILSPEIRFYVVEKMFNSETNIMSFLFFDICAVINNIEEDDIYLKIYYKPFMTIIWLSGFITCLGVIMAIVINKRKN